MEEPKTIRLIEDRWTVIRHAVEAIAIVAAGLWACYVFIYQERIKPALEPPSLELNLDFERGTIVRGVRFTNLVVTVHNTGHSDISFVGTTFSVFGQRFTPNARKPRPTPLTSLQPTDDRSVPMSDPELVWTFGQLRAPAKGGRATNFFIILPEQQDRFSLPVAVKEGQYDVLFADVQIGYVKAQGRTGYISAKFVKADNGSLRLELPDLDTNEHPDEIRAERTVRIALSPP